jgi:hypothetical protein
MAIVFTREDGGHYRARIDDIEIKVWPIGYEFILWGDVSDSPCDDEGCRNGRDDGECPCPYQTAVRTQLENDYCNGLSGWDEVVTTIRKKLTKSFVPEIDAPYPEPAASRFANDTWEFLK